MSIKQDILISAYSDFYNYGFNACGVELLAKQAGVTKRTLYAHFNNKEELITSVLDYRDTQFIQKLESFFLNHEDMPIAETYLKFISEWISEKDFHGCLFINASAEFHGSSEQINTQITQHKSKIRRILCEEMNKRQIKNAEHLANLLFLIGEGMIVAAQTGQTEVGKDWKSLADNLDIISNNISLAK